MNGQEIAQDAHAALGGLAPTRDRWGSGATLGDSREDFEFNGRFHCLGLLVSVDSVEELRSGLLPLRPDQLLMIRELIFLLRSEVTDGGLGGVAPYVATSGIEVQKACRLRRRT